MNKCKCTRCARTKEISKQIKPYSIRKWIEGGAEVTNYKYQCSCGAEWERTEARQLEKN